MSFSRRLGMAAAVALVSVVGLSSCGEKQEEAAAPAAAAEQASAQGVHVAREAVYRQLLEKMAPLVTDRAMVPEFNETAKVYLETLQAFYTELSAQAPSVERVDIGLRMAELTRNLGAYAKAFNAFEHALEDFEALPEAERNSVEGMRLHSALLNGTAVCLLSINKAADAITYYEKALELDLAVLRELGIAEGSELPKENTDANVSRAAADVLGSYRCLGECHAYAGDNEEARDIYKKGIELMTQLNNLDLNSGMGMALVKLHGALGDLENRCGNEKEALNAWVQAANLCNALFTRSQKAAIKTQARVSFNALRPVIQDKSRKLQAAAEAQKAADGADADAAAAAAAEAEKAAAAAAAAAEAQAAEEAKAAEAAAAAAEAEKAAAAREAETPKEERRRKRSRH